MVELIVLIIGVLVSAVSGAFVLSRNPRRATNRLYALLAVCLILWPVFNYLSLQTDDRLVYVRVVVFAAVLLAASLYFLLLSLNNELNLKSKWQRLGIYFTSVVAPLTLTPLVFPSLTDAPNPAPALGLGSVLFFAYVALFVTLISVYISNRVRKYSGRKKMQLVYIALGVAPTFLLAPITAIILPIGFQRVEFVALSPLYTTFFVLMLGYVILRHRLFDIRFVVARSIAYFLSIFLIASFYSLVIFGIVEQFLPDTQTSLTQQAVYVAFAILIGLSFNPIKLFFDKLSEKIFYRDRYETEDVLNRLGKVFVQKSNSFDLLDDALEIITDTLKSEYGYLVVMDGAAIHRIAATHDSDKDLVTEDRLHNFTDKLTIYDETQHGDEEHAKLIELGVHIVLRLEAQDSLVGYLLLSEKQSGTIFTKQDVNLLEILSQELAVAIQNAKNFEEIQAFSEKLEKEVEDATTELKEKNRRLEELDQAKDDFISMASHQLRTPLTTIKGYLSMLLDGDAGKIPKKQREFIDLSFVSSQRMAHLISDLLNVSRISTGRLTIDQEEFDLIKVAREELEQLEQQADARGVNLIFHEPDKESIVVNLDEGKMRQVIMNFTDNAVYYTPEGNVDVYIEKLDGVVEFKVKDDGIGVSEEDQKQLFTKFYRAENARHVRPDGTGLGLYMAKQVIEAQDGDIIFESEEGEGSTFGFRFRIGD